MRYAEALLQLWLPNDGPGREGSRADIAYHAHEADLARHAGEARGGHSIRRRAGEAVIAFGVRLAGDRTMREQRQLAGRVS